MPESPSQTARHPQGPAARNCYAVTANACFLVQLGNVMRKAGDGQRSRAVVADQPACKVDQARRQSRDPWPLHRISDSQGRGIAVNVFKENWSPYMARLDTAWTGVKSAGLRWDGQTPAEARLDEGGNKSSAPRQATHRLGHPRQASRGRSLSPLRPKKPDNSARNTASRPHWLNHISHKRPSANLPDQSRLPRDYKPRLRNISNARHRI
jgi:hypothetical protein